VARHQTHHTASDAAGCAHDRHFRLAATKRRQKPLDRLKRHRGGEGVAVGDAKVGAVQQLLAALGDRGGQGPKPDNLCAERCCLVECSFYFLYHEVSAHF